MAKDQSKGEDRLAKYAHIPGSYSTHREWFYAPKRSWVEQGKWDIPEKFVIKYVSLSFQLFERKITRALGLIHLMAYKLLHSNKTH